MRCSWWEAGLGGIRGLPASFLALFSRGVLRLWGGEVVGLKSGGGSRLWEREDR